MLAAGSAAGVASAHAQTRALYERRVAETGRRLYERDPEYVLRCLPENGYQLLRAYVQSPLARYLSGGEYEQVLRTVLARDLRGLLDSDREWACTLLADVVRRHASA